MSARVAIIGAGLAGLSTAYHLEIAGIRDYVLLEAEDRPGGLVRSETVNGYTFDYTGHLLHIKSAEMFSLMDKLCGAEMSLQDRKSRIIIQGHVTDYPIQVNTFGLPVDIVKECLLGLVKAKYESGILKVATFEDWILKSCGEGVAKWFMYPYNQKMWTVHPREMTCDWLGGFVPVPSIEDAIEGALAPPKRGIGYNAQFWYPMKGGIEVLAKSFLPHISAPRVISRVETIDVKKKTLRAAGLEIEYSHLVSTMPVTGLVRAMGDDAPDEVRRAATELDIAGIYSINYGVRGERSGLRKDVHWYYTPDPDVIFHRVGLPSSLSPAMTPDENCFSLCAEISYGRHKPLERKSAEEKCLAGLKKLGFILPEDDIEADRVIDIPYAYVIFDAKRARALGIIASFLAECGIISIGRYGTWAYSTMEQAVLDGMEAALRIEGERK